MTKQATPDMIERVARALADDARFMYERNPERWTDAARAAIEAMREPTEAMIDSAWLRTRNVSPEERMASELFMDARSLHAEKMKGRYGAMIDAALATHNPEEK